MIDKFINIFDKVVDFIVYSISKVLSLLARLLT